LAALSFCCITVQFVPVLSPFSVLRLRTITLTAFKGQTFKICFQAVEDNGSTTSFVLDDFKLVIE